MKKILLPGLFCLLALSHAVGQSAETKTNTVSRPDIPGSFKIDFGFNVALNKPAETEFKTAFFPTNALNLYYQYPIRFGKSKFSFNPGVGVSFERFKFTNGVTINRTPSGGRYEFVSASTRFTNSAIQKTVLSARYIDMPLEFRFDTKPEDVAHSFNFALGGRIGYLVDSMMKVKYETDSDKVTNKDKQNLGLTKFRYGVYTRLGIGPVNVFLVYNITPTFQAGIGPETTPPKNSEMNTFTTGISINGF
jgi:hypothetical protein